MRVALRIWRPRLDSLAELYLGASHSGLVSRARARPRVRPVYFRFRNFARFFVFLANFLVKKSCGTGITYVGNERPPPPLPPVANQWAIAYTDWRGDRMGISEYCYGRRYLYVARMASPLANFRDKHSRAIGHVGVCDSKSPRRQVRIIFLGIFASCGNIATFSGARLTTVSVSPRDAGGMMSAPRLN